MKLLLASLLLFCCGPQLIGQQPMPFLRKQGAATQLIVDGKPFLILAGELGNSSSSSAEYMRPVWPRLKAMNLNTVLIPVYWELIEPTEGKFDFTLVDALIQDARKNDLKIIPLWFASWKNSMSCYAPAWVKTNQKRFPRSEDRNGRGMEILSTFSKENVEADARAFAAFMRHLREIDSNDRTVIMVQVENEIGMIPDSRDRSQVANTLFNQQVPRELMDYLQRQKEKLIPEFRIVWGANGFKTQGTWEEIFGKGPATDELFMAWYFARFVERVTEAGKAEYNLPTFVNAALIRPGHMPGQYPSAGPLPHLMDIWRAGTPKTDFIAPDIYFQNFAEWVRKYDRSGNAVFIPEAMPGPMNAVNAMYAIGQHNSMGISPFSIENFDEASANVLTQSYDILKQLSPFILKAQGKGEIAGLLSEGPEQRQPQQLRIGGYVLYVTFATQTATPTVQNPGVAGTTSQVSSTLTGGLVIASGPDEFIIAGTGLTVTFEVEMPGDPIVGIAAVDEGTFTDGVWNQGRRLNGDQTHQGRHLRLPTGRFGIQRIKLYRYK